MKLLLIPLILLIPFKAFAFCDDWRTSDTVLAVSYSALLYMDWRQTMQGIGSNQQPGIYEKNIYLGRHPSDTALAQYMLSSAVGGLLLGCFLHGDYRTLWFSSLVVVELYAMNDNAHNGLNGSLSLKF